MLQQLGKDKYSYWSSQLLTDEVYRNYAEHKRKNRERAAEQQTENFLSDSLSTALQQELSKALNINKR